MHTETGFLRLPATESIEFILAQPTGQTELAEGDLEFTGSGLTITLVSRVDNSATAKHVEQTRRTYVLDGDRLAVEFAMAAVGVPLTHHLSSRLNRTSAGGRRRPD